MARGGRAGPGRVNRVGSGTATRTDTARGWHRGLAGTRGTRGDTGQRHVPRVYATCYPSRD